MNFVKVFGSKVLVKKQLKMNKSLLFPKMNTFSNSVSGQFCVQ